MADSDDEESPKRSKRDQDKLGNDLDLVDIGPEFQV